MKHVTIHTDGACSGNPGPGGYCAILVYGGAEKTVKGGEPETTNNRMELRAAIAGLEALREPCRVTLSSDSRYLVDAVNLGWAARWQESGWMRNKDDEAKNPDLWEALLALLRVHDVEFVWTKGHADDPYNKRCDALAVEQSKKYAKAE